MTSLMVQGGSTYCPVTFRKGTGFTYNPYPIYNFLNYHRMSPSYCCYISSFVFYYYS